MAATLSHPSPFSGTKKLNEHLQYYGDNINRKYPEFFWSGDKRRVCFCSSLVAFHKTSWGTGLRLKQQRRYCGAPFESIADIAHEDNDKDEVSQATLIWRAIKLPMYSVAMVPLTVGSAAAFLESGLFSAHRYFVLLASFVLVNVWVNLSNDVYDFDTGADKNKKESVVNLVGSTWPLVGAYISLILGFSGLSWISLEAESPSSLLLMTAAITCAYVYQCPPFRLSYKGLGEPLVFAAFGPLSTIAFYLLQSGTSELPITGAVVSSSFLVGSTSALILFCSHFHQIKGDLAVGKISPLVGLGTRKGADVLKMAIILLYLFLFVAGPFGGLPLECVILCASTIPMGRMLYNYVEENHKDDAKIFMSKYYCVRLHFAFGAALTAGLVAAKMFAGVEI